ncbi:MAG: hypothetical protein ABIJ12_03480 [bacterium]
MSIKDFFTFKAIFLGIILPITLMIIILISIYFYMHQGKEIYFLNNKNYKVSVVYYSGGLGTTGYLEIYSKSNFGKKQLLLFADSKDTVDISFNGEDTLQVIMLDGFYDNNVKLYWVQKDTLYFNLQEDNKVIRR